MFPTSAPSGEQLIHMPDGSGAFRAMGGRFSPRAADPLTDHQLGFDPIVTTLIVGQPRRRMNFGEGLFRRVGVPTWTFSYRKFGLETMEIRKAKRGMRAIIPFSDLSVTKLTGRLERYSWRTLADRDELLNAAAADRAIGAPTLSMRERYARAARQIVLLAMENDRATLVLATTSYSQSGPDLDLTLGSGSEWNDQTNGDSRANIRAMASTLATQHGLTIADIDVHLSNESFEAALDDPKFVTRRANYATAIANESELRAYWGVRSVSVGDAIYSPDGLTLDSLYGDIAVLDVSSELRGFDEEEGQLDNFVRFAWSNGPDGVAQRPWYSEEITSWSFPWEGWENPAAINTKASAIIRNTKA